MKKGKSRVLYGVSESFPIVAVVGLGPSETAVDVLEERDEAKEAVRTAVAGGNRGQGGPDLGSVKVWVCW